MMKIEVNVERKHAYMILFILVLGFASVFVVSQTPSPGHPVSAISPPGGCGSGDVLGWSGSGWVCTDSSGFGGTLTCQKITCTNPAYGNCRPAYCSSLGAGWQETGYEGGGPTDDNIRYCCKNT